MIVMMIEGQRIFNWIWDPQNGICDEFSLQNSNLDGGNEKEEKLFILPIFHMIDFLWPKLEHRWVAIFCKSVWDSANKWLTDSASD